MLKCKFFTSTLVLTFALPVMDLRLGKNAVFFKNTFYDFCIPILRLLTYCGLMPVCLHRVLKVKAVVAAFNQEKALVGAFSVITNLRMELFQALLNGEWDDLKLE